MNTPGMTLGFGGLLMGVGAGAYAYAATHAGPRGPSKTALIPAAYGAIFLGLGALARWGSGARKSVLGTATALAGVGAVGLSAMVISKMRARESVNPRAVAVQATTAVLSLGYALLGAGRPLEGRVEA